MFHYYKELLIENLCFVFMNIFMGIITILTWGTCSVAALAVIIVPIGLGITYPEVVLPVIGFLLVYLLGRSVNNN